MCFASKRSAKERSSERVVLGSDSSTSSACTQEQRGLNHNMEAWHLLKAAIGKSMNAQQEMISDKPASSRYKLNQKH